MKYTEKQKMQLAFDTKILVLGSFCTIMIILIPGLALNALFNQ